MAKRHALYSAVAAAVAVLSGPLAASIALYLVIQIFFDPVEIGAFPAPVLAFMLLLTLVFGPLLHGVLRKLKWGGWFHYAAVSAIVAVGAWLAISMLIDEWSQIFLIILVPLAVVTAGVSWWILQLDRDRTEQRRRIWAGALGAVVVVNASLIAFNFQQLVFVAAFVMAERRPALLADANWNDPTSARMFSARFRSGTNERELLAWLEANRFTVEPSTSRATRLIGGLPCAEYIEVTWTAPGQVIGRTEARVSEAGCL